MSRNGWISVGAVGVVAVALVVTGMLYRASRPVVVPDLTLKSPHQAAAALAAADLKMGSQGRVATDAVGPGLIAAQFPAPSAAVDRKSPVDVEVAVSPAAATVPDVHGLAVDEAVKTLEDMLFDVMVVDVFHAERTPGTVVQQSPAAGREWVTGRPVAVAAVVGPDDGTAVAVPKLKGLNAEQAYSALEAAGLQGTGFLVQPYRASVSVVVKQLPGKGVLVRPGATVLLLFDVP